MASFDIKSELDSHEVTNAVDQANRVLQNRFDFKGTGAEFKMEDKDILLSAKEEFQIHQMLPILNESITKRGIDKELAKKITSLVKQSKIKVQAAIQGDSVRITGKKRDELQQVIQIVKDQNYDMPLQFINFRD